MKSKYVGLSGVAVAGLALLVVVVELLWVSWHQVRPFASGRAFDAYSADRLMVDTEAIRRMDLVEPTVPKLVRPRAVTRQDVIGTVSDVDYSIFGDAPPKAAPPVAVPRAPSPKRSRPTPYRLAMTYLSGEHKYAVIDKKLYSENSRLPNGESLAEIADGAVRLDSPAGRRWISIDGASQ